MKPVLVIIQAPLPLDQIRSLLEPSGIQTVQRTSVESAEPLIRHGLASACLYLIEDLDIQGFWAVEKIMDMNRDLPVLVVTPDEGWTWEKEAYKKGVRHVLTRSQMDTLLGVILERILEGAPENRAKSLPTPGAASKAIDVDQPLPPKTVPEQVPALSALEKLRDFSPVLSESLCAKTLLERFLLALRGVIGVNRAVVFLTQPARSRKAGGATPRSEEQSLQATCAVGIPPEVLESAKLSLESGIGGYLNRYSRILQRHSAIVDRDPEMRMEFELLGGEVAFPILDRQSMIGVAVFDYRVTGEPLLNPELELIFHLLENVGLAIRNIWLHEQLGINHSMMAEVLQQLTNACIVVGDDLSVLHANKMARRYFKRGRRSAEFEFSDLPEELGIKVYQVLQTGAAIEPFKFSPPDSPETVYQVTIVPFQFASPGHPSRVLVVVEDRSQNEHLKQLEIEAANLRLVKGMSERLAHEIGNAIVPLATHEQLLKSKYEDEEFRESLAATMSDGVKRISRLARQMFFLAREQFELNEKVPLAQLIDEAFKAAKEFHSAPSAKMKFTELEQPASVSCDSEGLRYALTEVFLNALQANPKKSQIQVKASYDNTNGDGAHYVRLTVSDPGAGFSEESASHATEPFYTTRTVGIGLGLTVANKIIGRHHGQMHISSDKDKHEDQVEIRLPLAED